MFSKIISLLLTSFILTSCGFIPMPTITPTLTSTPTATAVPATATNTPTMIPTATLTPTATPTKMFPWADKEFASAKEARLAVEQDCAWGQYPQGWALDGFLPVIRKATEERGMPFPGLFGYGNNLTNGVGNQCFFHLTQIDDTWSYVTFVGESEQVFAFAYQGGIMEFASYPLILLDPD